MMQVLTSPRIDTLRGSIGVIEDPRGSSRYSQPIQTIHSWDNPARLAERMAASLQTLRKGIAIFLVLAGIGAASMLFIKGLGLAFIYAGLLAFVALSYRYGVRTGIHLVRRRYAILAILILSGLVLTACIATVERLLR